MKTLLYIGNKLSKHGYTPTSIETLGPFFEKEGYIMHYTSEKENQTSKIFGYELECFQIPKKNRLCHH